MKTITRVLLIATISCHVSASEPKSVQDLMVVSKMAGVCGVMQQMAQFQSATKMQGGAEFIERFWRVEFARLGKTQTQFFKECDDSISLYSQLWEVSEPSKLKK